MGTTIMHSRILMRYYRFQWVACQLEELRKCRKPSQITRTLATLPRTLNDTYERAISSVDEALWEDVLKALVLLAYEPMPLTLEALAEVTAIDLKKSVFDQEDRLFDTQSICTMCPGLFSPKYGGSNQWGHPANEERVTFNHFSVKEYLTSDGIRAGRAAQIPAQAEANGMIAEMYLIYLLNVPNSQEEEDEAQIQKQFPLYIYASYWPTYARFAGPANDRVNKAAIAFMQSRNFPRNPSVSLPLYTPLCVACQAGLTAVAQKLLEQGADVHEPVDRPPLVAAVRAGSSSLLQLLLQNGAADNPKNAEKALKYCALYGRLDDVKALVAHGADVNVPTLNSSNPTLLRYTIPGKATSEAKIEIVKFLLDHGANPFEPGGHKEMMHAVEGGDPDMAKFLFARGMKVNADVLCVADLKNFALVQWLIDHGADVNAIRDFKFDYQSDGISVLRDAVQMGLHKVADLLREHGAVLDMNFTRRDNLNDTSRKDRFRFLLYLE